MEPWRLLAENTVEPWRLWVAAGLGLISVVLLLRMFLALLGLMSSSGKVTRRSRFNRPLAVAHIFNVIGWTLVWYAQILFTGTKLQLPMDVVGVACLVVGVPMALAIEHRIKRTA